MLAIGTDKPAAILVFCAACVLAFNVFHDSVCQMDCLQLQVDCMCVSVRERD